MPSPVVLLVNVKACEGSLCFNDELVFGFKKMAIQWPSVHIFRNECHRVAAPGHLRRA